MRQLPDTYVVTEIACMDYRDNRTFVDKSEYDRLVASIERLTKERDEARRTVKMAHEEGTRQIATLQARIDDLAAEIERERTARKTAQESLEQYKGECTRLQHEVDRLKGCAERA